MVPPNSTGFGLRFIFLAFSVVPGVDHFGVLWAPGSYGQIWPGRVSESKSGVRPREVKLLRTGNADRSAHHAWSMTSKQHCEQHGSTQFGWFGTLVAREHRFAGARAHPFWPIVTVLVNPSPGAPHMRARAPEKNPNPPVRAPRTATTVIPEPNASKQYCPHHGPTQFHRFRTSISFFDVFGGPRAGPFW